jgi:hypothetical protein
VDSYGDGGLVFELFEDNSFSHTYIGGGDGNTWTFEAGNSGLPANDSPCGATEIFPDGEALLISNEGAVTQLSETSSCCWRLRNTWFLVRRQYNEYRLGLFHCTGKRVL